MDDIMNVLGMVWPFLILIGVFYFFMYKPQKKMQLERGRFLLSLKKGDHVVTSGGVHGTIKVLRDKYVELEIAPKVVVKVEKAAIHHGDVKLMDENEAIKAGAAAVGAAAENPEAAKKLEEKKLAAAKKDDVETEVVEEIVEVDNPEEEGTEIVEEVVEVEDEEKK